MNFRFRQWAYGLYCGHCRKMLTQEYGSDQDAYIAWHHGPDMLPPCCPFCGMPPKVQHPERKEPVVSCPFSQRMLCPLAGQTFTLEEWNRARPRLPFMDHLAKRWAKKPAFEKALRGLKRALRVQQRGRITGD